MVILKSLRAFTLLSVPFALSTFAPLAAAQVVVYDSRPEWTNAASPSGVIHCDDIESDTVGNYPSPYTTGGGFMFTVSAPGPISIVSPGSINGSQQVQFRDLGQGVNMTAPCLPTLAIGFDFRNTRGDVWSVTVGTQTFNLPINTTGFFGFTSNTPVNRIIITGGPNNQAMFALDNICCGGKGGNPDPCLRDSIQLNTGADHVNGGVLAIGALDPFYHVVADPDPNTYEPRPAGVILKHPAWANPEPNSQWLGGYPGSQAILNGYYVYEVCFCLQEGYQDVSLTLGAKADDEVQVFLNEPQPNNPNSFTNLVHVGDGYTTTPLNLTTISNPAQFHPGQNCIQFRVQNTGSVASGLNAVVTINAPGGFVLDPLCCSRGGTIMGQKWNDLNGDGIRQPNEPVLPNWTINLSPGGGTTTTDANGFYYFNGLTAGNYTITETQQTGWVQTYPQGGAGHDIALGTKQIVDGVDFGNTQSPPSTPCQVAAGQCCAGHPRFEDPAYAGFGPLVTIGTASPQALGTNVVAVFDVDNPNGGPFNTDFGAPIYAHPSWSETNLGSVFGVTLDATGNIFVAGASSYDTDLIGASSGGSLGVIYKIDAVSGVAGLWVTLPNGNATGLGNLNYDCEHHQLFASNMEDGKIYRLDMSGAVLSTFDFGVADNPANAFPPLGDRVWAVQKHNGRLYFSVWWENTNNASGNASNEIWSIALDGSGNFTGAAQLEIKLPPLANNIFSNPVADIRFTPTGTMLVAERGMSSATTNFGAEHQARLLEYMCAGGAGTPSVWVPAANTFEVGIINNGASAAGGVDVDFSANGRVYATGDALQIGPQIVYGTQGLPATGGTVANSVLIDYNGNLGVFDKTFIGDVAVPCPVIVPPCFNVSNEKITCPTGTSNCFTYTFNLTNKSGFTVKYITVPLHPAPNSPITINPNVINLMTQDGSLLNDGETTTITLTICNASPGDEFCFKVGLVTAAFVECCFRNVCITLPECDCGQLVEQQVGAVSCSSNGQVSFNYNFMLQNLSQFPADWVIFIPLKGQPGEFVKDFHFLPPLAPGGSQPMRVDIVGATPGSTFCFYVLLQHPGGTFMSCCCAFEKCITVPSCPPQPNESCPADVNLDGVVNVNDLLMVLNGWGQTPTPCPPSLSPDVNHDCVVNVNDLLAVISSWGPCP